MVGNGIAFLDFEAISTRSPAVLYDPVTNPLNNTGGPNATTKLVTRLQTSDSWVHFSQI